MGGGLARERHARGTSCPAERVPISARAVSTGHLGAAGGQFRPADCLTRQEAAVALVRAWETYTGRARPAEVPTSKDEARCAPESRSAFEATTRGGLLTCAGEGSRPGDAITRQEVAVAIYRILGFPW